MTGLRRRMIEDLQIRGYAPKTRKDYVRCVARFADDRPGRALQGRFSGGISVSRPPSPDEDTALGFGSSTVVLHSRSKWLGDGSGRGSNGRCRYTVNPGDRSPCTSWRCRKPVQDRQGLRGQHAGVRGPEQDLPGSGAADLRARQVDKE